MPKVASFAPSAQSRSVSLDAQAPVKGKGPPATASTATNCTTTRPTKQAQVHITSNAELDDLPELKVKQPPSQQQKQQQSRPPATPMSQLKKDVHQEFMELKKSVISEQATELDQVESTESQSPQSSEPESAPKASVSQSGLKERAERMRQKLIARKERRLSQESQEPSASTTSSSEDHAKDKGAADEISTDNKASIRQQRQESLRMVRQQWQEKQKKKQQEKAQAKNEAAHQAQVAQEMEQVAEVESEDSSEYPEPQSYMARIMKDYMDSQESNCGEQREVEGPPAATNERRNSKHTLVTNEQEVLGQHVGQWAEQKQQLLQRENQVRQRWEGLDGLLPPDMMEGLLPPEMSMEDYGTHPTGTKTIVSSFSSHSFTNPSGKFGLSIEPCPVPLNLMVGSYASEDCDAITVTGSGAVFFDVEDMGVVVTLAHDGTPLLRPRGKELALAIESDYAFRLIAHTETDLVWRDEVDASAPYVRWKRTIASELRR